MFPVPLKAKITETVDCRSILAGAGISHICDSLIEDIHLKLVITGTKEEIQEARLLPTVKRLIEAGVRIQWVAQQGKYVLSTVSSPRGLLPFSVALDQHLRESNIQLWYLWREINTGETADPEPQPQQP